MKESVPFPHFEIDYHLAFGGNFTIMCSVNQTSCGWYQLKSTDCYEDTMRIWNGSMLKNISFSHFLNTGFAAEMFFNVTDYDDDGNICQELQPYFRITEDTQFDSLKVLSSRFCIDLSPASHVYIVLVKDRKKNMQRKYCTSCFFISGDVLYNNISKCYCYCTRSKTFTVAIDISKTESDIQLVCFSNFTLSLNNSILHIFESQRYCNTRSKPQRVYSRLQRILVGKFFLLIICCKVLSLSLPLYFCYYNNYYYL